MTKRCRNLWTSATMAICGLTPLLTGPECPAFRGTPDTGPSEIHSVTSTEVQALIQDHVNDANFVILDVRTPEEFAAGHLQDARNVSVNGQSPSFTDAIAGFDRTKTYLVYCKAGSRSATGHRHHGGNGLREHLHHDRRHHTMAGRRPAGRSVNCRST